MADSLQTLHHPSANSASLLWFSERHNVIKSLVVGEKKPLPMKKVNNLPESLLAHG
jgi:hypothetical protein